MLEPCQEADFGVQLRVINVTLDLAKIEAGEFPFESAAVRVESLFANMISMSHEGAIPKPVEPATLFASLHNALSRQHTG